MCDHWNRIDRLFPVEVEVTGLFFFFFFLFFFFDESLIDIVTSYLYEYRSWFGFTMGVTEWSIEIEGENSSNIVPLVFFFIGTWRKFSFFLFFFFFLGRGKMVVKYHDLKYDGQFRQAIKIRDGSITEPVGQRSTKRFAPPLQPLSMVPLCDYLNELKMTNARGRPPLLSAARRKGGNKWIKEFLDWPVKSTSV